MFEEQYAYYPAQTVERIRNQVTMGALKGAAVKLGGMREGRKSIIFVSEGFTSTLPPQLNDPVAAMPGVGNPDRGDAQRRQTSDRSRVLQRDGRHDLATCSEVFREIEPAEHVDLRRRSRAASRRSSTTSTRASGCSRSQASRTASLDTLRALADNTDGRAIVNRNDLAQGMKQIIRDSSGYYLLGYNSTQAPTDGKFHEIKVEVTRKGVDVRARKGYWAYTAEDAARDRRAAKPKRRRRSTAALATLAEPPRGRPARFWIGTARGESGKTKVTFAWEPIAAAPVSAEPATSGAPTWR